MQTEVINGMIKNGPKVAELVEIKTKLGTILCATWKHKVVLFEFKQRKIINDILKRKSKYFNFVSVKSKNELHIQCENEINQYLDGKITKFEVPIFFTGTEFQKSVWKQLLEIPYGSTMSYGEIAILIGNEKSVRAVGAANGANSIAIIVPCHRVISSDGNLHGYGGGIDKKQKLLELESKVCNKGVQGELFTWFG